MTVQHRLLKKVIVATSCAISVILACLAYGQTSPAKPQTASAPATAKKPEFSIHAYHAEKLSSLECSICHTAKAPDSVELNRPGHDQCEACHSDAFEKDLNPLICAQCHNSFPPTDTSDLLPYPRYKGTRAILSNFSHALHVDKKERNDASGYRADCTFCHKFDSPGVFAKSPGHAECAACHSKAGMKPLLNVSLDTTGCRGCHSPEAIDNPSLQKSLPTISTAVLAGKYPDITFSHVAHFKTKDLFPANCTTCHNDVVHSTSFTDLDLPRMNDCVRCHESSQRISTQLRMSNCSACHAPNVESVFARVSHSRNVKTDFHNESFRKNHAAEAGAPNANCFACHQNVRVSNSRTDQCSGCHAVMVPISHTLRWKDDIHGEYAAEDRSTCATCHATDYCSRCHNELPRSHQPLAIFRGGTHAQLARLDERSCMTCHTYQDTCAECHSQNLGTPQLRPLQPAARPPY